ncbi:MAG: hypothetical protein JWL74_574 [Alphaproteobacteria bacterium]|jgi:hypothetical protein|nr:hypothetical protein [Alphaproteobacteria bacterium]
MEALKGRAFSLAVLDMRLVMSGKGLFGTGSGHLAEAGISYGAHFKRASRVGSRMLAAGGACFIHGIFPGIFTTTATNTIVRLNEELGKGHKPGDPEPALLEFEI